MQIQTEAGEMPDNQFDEIKKKRQANRTLDEIHAAETAAARRRLIRVLIVVAVIAVGAAALWLISHLEESRSYDSYNVLSESDSGSRYCATLGKLILGYSANGISATDMKGERKWDQGYTMTDPVLVSSGPYALVYDRGGTEVSVFDENGAVTGYTLPAQIAAAGVSSYGMGAFMTRSGNTSSVVFYDRTGRKLDIEVKNVLAESSGYPIAMSLSPSGTGLVLSLTFLDRGSVQTRISFLNFDEGKDRSDRVVGFYEYDDILFPEVEYLSARSAVAFGDDRAVFYSLENAASPKVSEEVVYTERVSSVAAGDGMAAVVLRSANGGYTLKVYDMAGDETLSYGFDFEYTHITVSGEYVMLYGGETSLITTASHVKFLGKFEGIVNAMVSVGRNEFLQYGDFGTRVVELD